MSKLIGSVFALMTIVAVTYCNYHAVREGTPWFKRQIRKITNSRIVQGTKAKASSASSRVVHIFKRRETA